MSEPIHFEDWMKILRDVAIKRGMNMAKGFDGYMHPDNWRQYFYDEYSPMEALDEDMSYMD